MFTQFRKIIPGGLIIYHGLIAAVGSNILPHFEQILNNLCTAMSFDFNFTDEFSMRLACGLVTDLANDNMEKILTKTDTLIPILR